MTVIDFNRSASSNNASTALDIVNAVNEQVLFARGIWDAIRGAQEIIGDQHSLEGPSSLIAIHIEYLEKIAAKLEFLRKSQGCP
jgi:hypothetical protein